MSQLTLDELTQRARAWMDADPDPETRDATAALLKAGGDGEAELRQAFGDMLAFGTAGIRGVLGPGPGNMNRALVRRVTAGLANYLADTVPEARERGVVLGHDARRGSVEFAADTAAVLAGAGFKVLVCPPLCPTPLVAFAVKRYGAAAGVVVTASHNPPAYNGYKVYWENGAQIIPPHDAGIAAAIEAVEEVPMGEEGIEEAPATLGQEYLAAIAGQVEHVQVTPHSPRERVVYTPLHGVGADLCERALVAQGVEVLTVPEQRAPDGTFPTVEFPNPEEAGALDLALALAEKESADLVMANDPDADRLALVVRADGRLRALTGDETGAVFADALLAARGVAANQEQKAFVGRTIVSAELIDRIADQYGATCIETLTGFKWLWNAAAAREARGETFVFAYEEALGHSVGPVVRDKDGIGAAVLAARLCRSERSIWSRLCSIWERHGFVGTRQQSLVDAAPGGVDRHAARMALLRRDLPTAVAGIPVIRTRDYLHPQDDLPATDCLALWLQDGTRLMLRPSGTEPKLKVYAQVTEPWSASAQTQAAERLTHLHQAVAAHLDGLEV